jgi:RimJ/RimL family protein N-acetyltransferase
MVTFREMQQEDLPFLIEVRNECRAMLHDDSAFTLDQAQAWFAATRPRFYIVTHEGTAVGYFRTSHWNEANRHVSIGCDLHKDHRSKGLAQAAYRVFLRFLFEDCAISKVSLEVLEHNVRARRLYQRLGFVVEGVKRREVYRDGRHLDSIMMSMLKSAYQDRNDGN